MKINLVALIIVICVNLVNSWTQSEIIIKDPIIQFDENLCSSNFTKEENGVSLEMNIFRPIINSTVSIKLFMESFKNNYITIFEKTLNVCRFFKNPSNEPLVKIIYDELVKSGNMFDRCPIKEGKYTIKNFKMDSKKMPPYLPASTYKLIIINHDYVDSQQIFLANATISIIVDNSNQIKRLSFMGLKL